MKKFIEKSVILFIIIILLSISGKLLVFAENEKFEIKTNPKKSEYIISSDSSYPPFEFQDAKSGLYVGIEVELMNRIAKLSGFKIKMNFVGFDTAVSQLESNQADGLMGGMSMSEERILKYTFSKPYYNSKLHLATKKGNPYKIGKYSDLKDKTVGVKLGTAALRFLEKKLASTSKYKFKIKKFDTADMMYSALATDNIEAVFDDEPIVEYAILQGKDLELVVKSEPVGKFGFAVKKGENEELVKMFNEGLDYLKETGEYDKIIEKYTSSPEENEEEENILDTSREKSDESTFIGVLKTNWKIFLEGFSKTIILATVSFALALFLGIILGLVSTYSSKTLKIITSFYVDTVRGIPLMVFLFFIFFGLSGFMGIKMPEMTAGIIALTLNGSAYITEIIRGGILALPSGQMEASRCLGLSYNKTMQKVILPQVFKITLPSLVNQFIMSLKDTTIVSVIGFSEIIHVAKDVSGRNMQPFFVYGFVGIIFLTIIMLLAKFAKILEKRMNKKNV